MEYILTIVHAFLSRVTLTTLVLVVERNPRLGQFMKFDVIFGETAVVQHTERLNGLYIGS